MRIFNIVTQKGGTGKSETAKNLAYGLSCKGLKVFIVDLDPQSNTSGTVLNLNKVVDVTTLEAMKKEFDKRKAIYNGLTGMEGIEIINEYMNKNIKNCDISDVLLNPRSIRNAIIKTKYPNISIIPSSSKLVETDMRLKASPVKSDTRLSMALSEVENEYDVCIIDNSPIINAITINGITACKSENDIVIIPIKIENGSLEGVDTTLQQMLEIIEYSSELGFDFKLLFTMRNRNKIESEIEETLRYLFPDRCFNSKIRYQAKPVVQASLDKKILLEEEKDLKKKSGVAIDYNSLVDEVYEMMNN